MLCTTLHAITVGFALQGWFYISLSSFGYGFISQGLTSCRSLRVAFGRHTVDNMSLLAIFVLDVLLNVCVILYVNLELAETRNFLVSAQYIGYHQEAHPTS